MLVADQSKSDRVLNALADEHSRKILLSIISKSLSVDEISQRTNVPLSTCYSKIRALKVDGMLKSDRIILDDTGKKSIFYISTLKNVKVNFGFENLAVEVDLNVDPLILSSKIAR